ncbi:MAG: LicD family protein [Pseudobutyrivibrio sp.]|nr:LicD family protein [Pseudobutyrivibrio sp.]
MRVPQEDIALINIIKSYTGEYYDEYLRYDSRERNFWNLSCIQKNSLEWYSFEADSSILVLGDKFGTIVGATCDKSRHVDVIVEAEQYREAVRHRYSSRNNLNVIAMDNLAEAVLSDSYEYVVVYLQDCWDFDWNNSYKVDGLLEMAKEYISQDSRLIVLARGDKAYDLERILHANGFKYQNNIDPMGNGFLFIESSPKPFEKQEISADVVEMNRNMLVEHEWVKNNWMPQGGGEVVDQDYNLIEEVKKVEVDLLSHLLDFCEAHSLQVYPIYGTLLGLMRDGGLIPGDDDIDVALPRADFDKLVALRDEFTGDYFLQTPYNDNCFYGGYLKLRNKATTAINPQNEFVDVCEGIGIDIFPLDDASSDSRVEKRKVRAIRFLQRLLFAKAYGYFRQFRDMPMLKWKGYKYLGKLFDRNKIIEKLYSKMSKVGEETDKYAIYCHYNWTLDNVRYYDKKDFKMTFPLLYEGQTIDVPTGWEAILKAQYGEGWWMRPGFAEWKRRHGFYDVNTPYRVYKKRFSGLHYPSTITEPIVFFGDGSVFKDCLDYYKSRVNIANLVQLPGNEPMKSVMGIDVESWEEFVGKNIPKDTYRAVICSGNSREAERFLKNNGFTDYYIFWYDREWMLYANQSAIWSAIKRS